MDSNVMQQPGVSIKHFESRNGLLHGSSLDSGWSNKNVIETKEGCRFVALFIELEA